jgi:hypothetical protein
MVTDDRSGLDLNVSVSCATRMAPVFGGAVLGQIARWGNLGSGL